MNIYNQKHKLGKLGEELSAKYLISRGFEIIAQNYHCPEGEIDIIARKGNLLIIVEVKTRSTLSAEDTLLAVTKAKQRKISRATAYFLEKNQQFAECNLSFDIITVIKHSYLNEYSIKHYDNAFCYLF